MSSPSPSLANVLTEMPTPIVMPAPINAPTPDITFDPTPTGAHMDVPMPDTMSIPTPTMDVPTPHITVAPISAPTPDITTNPTPPSAPTGTPNPNPNPQSGNQASRTSTGTPWGNQASLAKIWGSKDHRFTDESSHLFSLYLAYAEKRDKELTENWIAGADGILVFTGLFAAALATFVIDSYKNLLPDSGSNTVALLTQISQQLANGSQASSLVASVPAFTPPTSAVWVNALWFLSLVISLFCALLATLQQSWARRYIRLTNTQCAVHKRARLRSFFAEGVDRFHLPFVVEAIPTLIHISMFLFFTGLVISLFSIHHTIARVILTATGVCGLLYMVITLMPVICHNSPYQTPLSRLIWDVPRTIFKALLSAAYYIVSFLDHTGFIEENSTSSWHTRITARKERLSVSMVKAAEKAAESQGPSIYARALSWTLDQSEEESELEKFVAGISKFMHSAVVENPMRVLKEAVKGSSSHPSLYRDVTTLLVNAAIPRFLRSYKELPDDVRRWRVEMCVEAFYFIPQAIEKMLRRVSKNLTNEDICLAFTSVLDSQLSWQVAMRPEFWKPLQRRDPKLESATIGARCMAAVIASRSPKMTHSVLKQLFRLDITNPDVLNRYDSEESRHNFLLKNLNHFIERAAFEFIDVDVADIFISTVRIITENLQLDSAAQEFRVEFEGHFARLTTLARDHGSPPAVQKNATDLLSQLDRLRNPPSANGSTPLPMAQTDSPTPMSPASPIQSPQPMSSPSPGDAYVTMPSYPPTPYREIYPLMPMSSQQTRLSPLPTPSKTPSRGNFSNQESV